VKFRNFSRDYTWTTGTGVDDLTQHGQWPRRGGAPWHALAGGPSWLL